MADTMALHADLHAASTQTVIEPAETHSVDWALV